ncbi:hypothetical protein OAU50_08415 [Planctomycetota bacterium]|nr:hypothetical protein [Planctomycetota bacterium]
MKLTEAQKQQIQAEDFDTIVDNNKTIGKIGLMAVIANNRPGSAGTVKDLLNDQTDGRRHIIPRTVRIATGGAWDDFTNAAKKVKLFTNGGVEELDRQPNQHVYHGHTVKAYMPTNLAEADEDSIINKLLIGIQGQDGRKTHWFPAREALCTAKRRANAGVEFDGNDAVEGTRTELLEVGKAHALPHQDAITLLPQDSKESIVFAWREGTEPAAPTGNIDLEIIVDGELFAQINRS